MGGSHRVNYEFCNAMAERGHTVKIIVASDGKYIRSDLPIGFEIITYYKGNSIFTKIVAFFLLSGLKIRKTLKKEEFKPECIIIQNLPSLISYRLFCRNSKSKLHYIFYGPCSMEYYSKFKGDWKNKKSVFASIGMFLSKYIFQRLEKAFLKGAFLISVLSEYSKKMLESTFSIDPNRIILVPGAVNGSQFIRNENKRTYVRSQLGVGEKTLILTIRRLEERMGLDVLIEGINLLRNNRSDFLVAIGGKGSKQKYLEQMIERFNLKDFVVLLGFIPENELADYYSAADLFILPSVVLEGFGLVVLESLSCGTPVICFPEGGQVEIIRDFTPNLIMQSISPKEIAYMLNKILSNPDEYLPLTEACINYSKKFNWDKFTEKHLEILFSK